MDAFGDRLRSLCVVGAAGGQGRVRVLLGQLHRGKTFV